jgi:hypothetical protein
MVRPSSAPTLEQEARDLVERLGGRWSTNGGLCNCPAHDDRRPSLSVRPGRSRLLLHCFAGCTAWEVLKALVANGLVDPSGSGPPGERVPEPAARLPSAPALRIWGAARPLEGTPAEAYL